MAQTKLFFDMYLDTSAKSFFPRI